MPPEALAVRTPLQVSAWKTALAPRPHKQWTEALLNGLQCGFRIGHNHAQKYKRARSNCKSACDHPYVVTEYLASKLALGRVAGPFEDKLPRVMVSKFGVISKSNKPGK